jgi:hypothetical protein
MCSSPERFESSTRPDEPRLRCVQLFHSSAHAKLEDESSKVEYLRRDHEYRHPSKAPEDWLPLAVAELGVDSMEEVKVGSKWLVPAQVVVANVYLRKDLREALYRHISVVGHDQLATGTKLVQPPLEGSSSYTVRGNNSRALSLEPRVDCARSTRDVGSLLGSRVGGMAKTPLVLVRSLSHASGRTRSSPTMARFVPKS